MNAFPVATVHPPTTIPSCCPFLRFDSYGFLPLFPSLYNAFLRVCWYFTLFGALYKLKHWRDKDRFFLAWLEIQSIGL